MRQARVNLPSVILTFLHRRIIRDREQPEQETFRLGRWSLDFGRNESTHRASRVCKLPPTARD
jgi:hypothetical protein